MLCPVDKTAMKEIQAYDAFLDMCPECMGVWFDYEELRKMTEKLAFGVYDKAIKGADKSSRVQKDHFWQEDSLECPRDYHKMQKRDYAGDSKIHIDHCVDCGGFWIDGDEIKKLENYLKPDPVMDLMGQAVLHGINEREEWKKEAQVLPYKLMQFVATIGNPKVLVLYIIKLLVDAGVAYARKEGPFNKN